MPRPFARLLLLVMASATATLPLAAGARAADDGMQWQFNEFNDPANKGRLTARLVYGVPETDNVMVTGVCDGTPSTSARYSSVTFGTDTGTLKDGAEADLRFTGGGFHHVMRGTVRGTEAGEGVSGIHLELDHNDPLWSAMLEKQALDYFVPGYRAATLDLSRGTDKIKAFINTCRAYAAAVRDEAAPAPGATAGALTVPAVSCSQLGKLRSKNSNTPAKITFVNDTGMYRSILWLDFKGHPKTYANLNPGERVLLDTYLTHPWMVTDGPGNCVQILMPVPGAAVVNLGRLGAAPVPPSTTAKPKCRRGYVSIDGRCIRKQDAATHCGPGYRLVGNTCVQGYKPPKPGAQRPSWQIEAIQKGCKPGLAWNPQEGCHEND